MNIATLTSCERTLASLLFRKYATRCITQGLDQRETLKKCFRQSRADARIISLNHNYAH